MSTGSQANFNIYDNDASNYGKDPATPSATKLYLKSCGLSVTQARLQDDTLTGSRTVNKPDNDNVDAVGALVANIGAESIGKLLKHTFGTVATVGTNPYTHTITIGALPDDFLIEKDFGSQISGSGRVEKFVGCAVASMDVDMPANGYATVTFNVQAANGTNETAALDATPTDSGHTSFTVAAIANIQEGGVDTAVVKTCKFSLNNDLDTDGYVLGSGGIRGELEEGFALVTVELTALFKNAALLTKAENSTASSLKVVLSRGTADGSAGNESIEFLSGTMVFERTSIAVDGPKGLMVNMKATGYSTNALQVILKNAVATL